MRILLGWELGANLGHAQNLIKIGSTLQSQGAEVFIAAQQLDAVAGSRCDKISLLQAPVWPNLLKDVRTPRWVSDPADYGEIFSRLCLDREYALGSMLAGWETLLNLTAPDLVISDTAPALNFTASQRYHTIRIGSGYDTPPSEVSEFPRLRDIPSSGDNASGLRNINKTLKGLGRTTLRRFPEFFRSDGDYLHTIPELDPYKNDRPATYCPSTSQVPAVRSSDGEEIFVYLHAMHSAYSPLWKSLASLDAPVRLFIPSLHPNHREAFDELGFKWHEAPVPLENILQRSRLIITSGGIGLVTAAVAQGTPQVVIHHDLEKQMTGEAIERIGCGRSLSILNLTEANVTSAILECYSDS
ncbi:MAG: nucleotide disphospho-sugar-binding domain-containing protein, partial [Marinomonas sp.]